MDWTESMSEKRKYTLREGSKPPGRPTKGDDKRKNITVALTPSEIDEDSRTAAFLGISRGELYRRMRRSFYANLHTHSDDDLDNVS